MSKSVFTAITVSALTFTGCATTGSTAPNQTSNSAQNSQRVAQSSGPYQFSTPETGVQLDGYNAVGMNRSLYALLEPLPENERYYMAAVVFTVAGYEGCVKHGYTSQIKADDPMVGRRTPADCTRNVGQDFRNKKSLVDTYMKYGRVDSHREKKVTNLVTGTRIEGWSDVESWQKFVNWSGAELHGKTRTDLMTQFHALTGGSQNGPPNAANAAGAVVRDEAIGAILGSIF